MIGHIQPTHQTTIATRAVYAAATRPAPSRFSRARRTHAPSSPSRCEERASRQCVDRQPAWSPSLSLAAPAEPVATKPNADSIHAKTGCFRLMHLEVAPLTARDAGVEKIPLQHGVMLN
jgi:hypothetical protein